MAREYKNDYPSVTTVLGVLRKIGLEMWYKINTAKFCDDASKKGREIGTQSHAIIEQIIETGTAKFETEYADEVKTIAQSFLLFKKEHPEIILKKSEILMTSELYKFNGTLDCIAEIDGEQVLLDWKTGEAKEKEKPSIYEEYLFQVSAYVNAYNEIFNANIKKAIIVSMAKDKVCYNYQEISETEIREHFENAFLPCLKIFNHQKSLKGKK